MDDRLAFLFAAQEIARTLGMTPGAAQAKLRELCKSGEVRAWQEPYSMVGGEPHGEGPPQLIEPSEWRQHEIDVMTDSDGCKYFVNVSKVDLGGWLKAKQVKPRAGKVPLIIDHLAQMFLNGVVPDRAHRPRMALRADLLKRDPTLKPLDEATLKKAIDEYNADPKRS